MEQVKAPKDLIINIEDDFMFIIKKQNYKFIKNTRLVKSNDILN